jgi:hypothetical protein
MSNLFYTLIRNFLKKLGLANLIAIIALICSVAIPYNIVIQERAHQEILRITQRQFKVTKQPLLVLRNSRLGGKDLDRLQAYSFGLPDNVNITIGDTAYKNIAFELITAKNEGREVIRQEDFVEPISLTIPEGCEILPATKNPDLKPAGEFSGNKLTIHPRLFNPDDEIKAVVAYSFPENFKDSSWDWTGKIAGVRDIQFVNKSLLEEFKTVFDNDPLVAAYNWQQGPKISANIAVFLVDWEIASLLALFATISFCTLRILRNSPHVGTSSNKQVAVLITILMLALATSEIVFWLLFREIDWRKSSPLLFGVWTPVVVGYLALIAMLVRNSRISTTEHGFTQTSAPKQFDTDPL